MARIIGLRRLALTITGLTVAAATALGTASPAMAENSISLERQTPRVGTHVPATMLEREARCGVPSTASDKVMTTVKRVLDRSQAPLKVRRATFAAAWVESHGNNLDCGDSDSIGVFQQRPSMGWGSRAQILDVEFATKSFLYGNPSGGYGAIAIAESHPDWTAGQVAQEVQRSAYPKRYDQEMPTAMKLIQRIRRLDGGYPKLHLSFPTVGKGETSTRARVIQLLLNHHKITVARTGYYGDQTTAAVKTFQRRKGLPVTGTVDRATWKELAVSVEPGHRGWHVNAVQWELRSEGYQVPVTGKYDAATVAAVKSIRGYYRLAAGDSVYDNVWRTLVHRCPGR